MKNLVIGILAHVDAGKTTLSEGLLYAAGALRAVGRVDHGDAFLDTDVLERERGITIFSKQAVFEADGAHITLLDTPGHVDFSAEAERTLQILDYAVLVISATDGVQSHTRTLWRLLARYNVPTFLFINKMDLAGAEREALMTSLTRSFGGCVDFTAPQSERDEAAALTDEAALEELLSTGALSDDTLASLIRARKIFPCCFGAALRQEGTADFLSLLTRFTRAAESGTDFGARVFKITRDAQGTRLTHLRVTGGTLRAKMQLSCGKADQLRLYSGAKFRPVDAAAAGEVVAVTGLEGTRPGQGLGAEQDGEAPLLESVLSYRIFLPDGTDVHTVLPKLRQLEDEDPMLHIVWDEHSGELHAALMGEVQLEILQRRILDRFGLAVTFGEGSIVYRETITGGAVEGVGHFEPLRHYAEVHLLLEAAPRGSGVQLASVCPTDQLDLNWQRLILTHLAEREHAGVLTGSALTDVKLTLLAGRAHLKHTEGGDFRQATYRAVRQGLMHAESVLLEPYYDFRLSLPPECVGRAMTDLAAMGATTDAPLTEEDETVLTGFAPVAALRSYARDVAAYTRGRGRLSCALRGYEPCANAEAVVAAIGYDPERDVENPTGSVFCEHGAGVYVKWGEVAARAHVPCLTQRREDDAPAAAPARRSTGSSIEQDKELLAIFESTYGKVERRAFEPKRAPARTSLDDVRYSIKGQKSGPEYLLVDGYNIIFAWNDLKKLAAQDIAAAREALVDILANYRGWRKCEIILVFDAYKVKGNPGSIEKRSGIYIVYTKEAQTADSYIERATYDLGKEHRVRVATSDNLEQVIILGHGALRISARAFEEEVIEAEGQIAALIERWNCRDLDLRRLRTTAKVKPPKD